MALDSVPWFVGGGARHSAAAARNLAWNATGGATGIATPKSLQVRQTSTPGGNVQIMPGGCVIESTYAGALQQSYTVRNASATNVAIPGNSTSSAVTHYITVEVNDPLFAGANPPSKEEGPYVYFRVRTSRQSVHPEHLIATVRVPANTPNPAITNGMITDRRELANPKWKMVNRARPSLGSDNGMTLTSTTGEWFPGGGDATGARQEIDVPAWATRMVIEATWIGVRYEGGKNSYGTYWIGYGASANQNKTQEFMFNSPGSAADGMRANWPLADYRTVPSEMRGRTGVFSFMAKRDSGSSGRASMDGLSGLSLKVTFMEEPDPSTE